MGLERIAAVLQGACHNNYDIDLFQNLLAAAKAAVRKVSDARRSTRRRPPSKVIADHIRACVLGRGRHRPGNEGRAYVLRRICRRAIRHGYKFGRPRPLLLHARRRRRPRNGDALTPK